MTPAVKHLGPDETLPTERHVAVIAHRDQVGAEKGYFFDSAGKDHGGSGPFDWRLSEAIERAQQFARDKQISLVVVRTQRV